MNTILKAVIIDDMPLAIESLKSDIEALGCDIEIVGTAGGVLEGAKLLNRLDVDLVFLDIHMDDGDGFDLLEIIDRNKLAVIFTTASEAHAVKAFRYSAEDYLLKPIDSDQLKEAIRKVRTSSTSRKSGDEKTAGIITLSTQDEIRRVPVDRIIRLEATGNYCTVFLKEGDRILLSRTLKSIVSQLPDRFVRVHQSHVVNTHFIKSYIKTEGGYLMLEDGSRVPVSVRRKPGINSWISKT